MKLRFEPWCPEPDSSASSPKTSSHRVSPQLSYLLCYPSSSTHADRVKSLDTALGFLVVFPVLAPGCHSQSCFCKSYKSLLMQIPENNKASHTLDYQMAEWGLTCLGLESW